MKLKGTVLAAKKEERSLTSKTDGLVKKHEIYHVLLLAKTETDNEVLNCESWNPTNFVLPDVGKEWVTPPIKSIVFEGNVGKVSF